MLSLSRTTSTSTTPPTPSLYDLDLSLETSRLLSTKPIRHHVRIQGKIALVRSIPTANLRRTSPSGLSSPLAVTPTGSSNLWRASAPSSPVAINRTRQNKLGGKGTGKDSVNNTSGVAILVDGESCSARQSISNGQAEGQRDDDDNELEEEELRHLNARDGQLRGYGIGGAGNIRRATDTCGPSTSPKKRSLRDVLGLGQWKDERLGPVVRAVTLAATRSHVL